MLPRIFQKKVKISFIPPHFQFDKGIQETSQWFMSIESGSTLVPEEAPPNVTSSASTTIQSAINLKYNQKTTVAAIIKRIMKSQEYQYLRKNSY